MTKRTAAIVSVFMFVLVSCSAVPKEEASQAGSLAEPASEMANSLAVYTELERVAEAGENIVFSPVSLDQAFGLVQLGAQGDTAEQIERVLGIQPGEAGARSLRDLRTGLSRDTPGVSVRLSNALFLSDTWQFAPAYTKAAQDLFAARTATLDFSERPEEAAAVINRWAKDATQGLIPSVINPQSINRDAAAYLANATFFDGEWTFPFQGGKTAPFLFGDGTERDWPLMEGRLHVPFARSGDWQAVRIAYGQQKAEADSRFVMDIMMPTERIADIPALTGAGIGELATALDTASARNVHVWMPRFQADMRRDLIGPLRSLGLELPFDRARADLSGMSAPGYPRLYIDEAFQVATLRVNERGTRAAAVTLVVPAPVSMPPPFKGIDFTIDRPFIFAIRDLATGSVLFVGRIAAPQPMPEELVAP